MCICTIGDVLRCAQQLSAQCSSMRKSIYDLLYFAIARALAAGCVTFHSAYLPCVQSPQECFLLTDSLAIACLVRKAEQFRHLCFHVSRWDQRIVHAMWESQVEYNVNDGFEPYHCAELPCKVEYGHLNSPQRRAYERLLRKLLVRKQFKGPRLLRLQSHSTQSWRSPRILLL